MDRTKVAVGSLVGAVALHVAMVACVGCSAPIGLPPPPDAAAQDVASACGGACGPGTACVGRQCVAQADASAVRDAARDADARCGRFRDTPDWCDGACVDLTSDSINCGRCGARCSNGQKCFGGFCFAARDAGPE